jgi:type IV secretory pathway ATPase VirB11/archaellum biosynthesis ATPase
MSCDAGTNPFRASRVLEFRYRFVDSNWDGLLARLSALGMRGAIVGPEGSGKTTLLEDLGERLRAAGRRVVLLDGAERMSRREWREFLRSTRDAEGLVVTAHREGLLPTLLRTRTTPEILEAAVLAASGRSCDSFGISPEELWTRHGGNVRTALRELYDVCAGRRGQS